MQMPLPGSSEFTFLDASYSVDNKHLESFFSSYR
uniref:Uncharacterized protein n=1 Tax=Anguilla anguilla TaxID=7936 RepID=A0A0E9U2H3_ANGAN